MRKNLINLIIVLPIFLIAGIACSSLGNTSNGNQKPGADSKPTSDSKSANGNKLAKLDSYSIKGFKFAYYKIPAGLKKEELIETAQKIHDQEADTQVILVDDDSRLADYIKYAKAISGQGELDEPMPMEWADKHIIANVQKYTSGKFVLCEGYGSSEIADLK